MKKDKKNTYNAYNAYDTKAPNEAKSKKKPGIINITNVTNFRFVESYKTLRTNVLFAVPAKEGIKNRKIVFTSACPGEGKTTTTVNLAIALSETERKILLIDADMRKPTVHRYFNIESRIGLSNLLSGMNTQEECVHHIEGMPNLDVIPSGILPPNPSELLGSSAMEKALLDLEKEYDYIIIDTPPVNIVSDVLSIVGKIDGVVVVISPGKSTYPETSKAIETLKFANANIIGAVMNGDHGLRKRKNSSYGAYSYKYKYIPATNVKAER